jgi:ribokinase
MGAGFACAFGGTLHLLLGDESEPIGRRVIELLDGIGIAHRATHVPGRLGEWTLLVTSGEFGDKLPIGFRDPGTHDAPIIPSESCDLLVAASMTNRRAAAALARVEARVRLFAPAMRNVTDTEPKVSSFAGDIDILCCNRTEWESIADREEVAWRVSILAVTDGPRGAEIRYTTPTGDAGRLEIPAFPRREPPKDTNRAGEAFASRLVTTLLDGGWSPGTTEEGLIRRAAERASAAAALELDRVDFGFPTAEEVDRALLEGLV